MYLAIFWLYHHKTLFLHLMYSSNQKVNFLLLSIQFNKRYNGIKSLLRSLFFLDFEDILTTVYFLMQKNPKVKLWSTYQVRR